MEAKIIDVALREYGNREIAGNQDEPEVMKYYHDIGHEWVANDEVAWCAAFTNWVLKQAGYEMSEYAKRLSARSFEGYGEETFYPNAGDIVVLWRIEPDGPYGHVGFFIREKDGYIYMLSGNQNNEVNIDKYPLARKLTYRKPVKI